jgi:hypothetical protein
VEVVEAADGSGPLFRARPKGGQWVEASSATRCWTLLMGGDGSDTARARAVQKSGPKMFGLSHAVVKRMIHALPDAARWGRLRHAARFTGSSTA